MLSVWWNAFERICVFEHGYSSLGIYAGIQWFVPELHAHGSTLDHVVIALLVWVNVACWHCSRIGNSRLGFVLNKDVVVVVGIAVVERITNLFCFFVCLSYFLILGFVNLYMKSTTWLWLCLNNLWRKVISFEFMFFMKEVALSFLQIRLIWPNIILLDFSSLEQSF